MTGRLTDRNVSKRESGNDRMEPLDPRQSLALFSIRTLAPCSTDTLKIPQTDVKKMFILLRLMKGNTCENVLGWTLNDYAGAKCPDVYMLIMTRKT